MYNKYADWATNGVPDNPVPSKIEFRAVACVIIIIISCVHAFHCGVEIAGQVIRGHRRNLIRAVLTNSIRF